MYFASVMRLAVKIVSVMGWVGRGDVKLYATQLWFGCHVMVH